MRAVPALMYEAQGRGGAHAANLSIIAVRWAGPYADESSARSGLISPKTMPRDTVTTRLDEFGRLPSRKTELTEEEIELAIEEIRSTIQKYSK